MVVSIQLNGGLVCISAAIRCRWERVAVPLSTPLHSEALWTSPSVAQHDSLVSASSSEMDESLPISKAPPASKTHESFAQLTAVMSDVGHASQKRRLLAAPGAAAAS